MVSTRGDVFVSQQSERSTAPPLRSVLLMLVRRTGRWQGTRFRGAVGVGREAKSAEGKPFRVVGTSSAFGAAEVRHSYVSHFRTLLGVSLFSRSSKPPRESPQPSLPIVVGRVFAGGSSRPGTKEGVLRQPTFSIKTAVMLLLWMVVILTHLRRRRLDAWCRCKVSGDLEARASAEHPPGTPLWSVFNCGYRREQDAVWAATCFKRKGDDVEGSSRGNSSSSNGDAGSLAPNAAAAAAAAGVSLSASPSSSSVLLEGRTGAASVTVDVAHFSSAGGMLRDALDSLAPKGAAKGQGSSESPSLLWVDLPCRRNDFDQDDNDKNWSSLPQVRRRPQLRGQEESMARAREISKTCCTPCLRRSTCLGRCFCLKNTPCRAADLL